MNNLANAPGEERHQAEAAGKTTMNSRHPEHCDAERNHFHGDTEHLDRSSPTWPEEGKELILGGTDDLPAVRTPDGLGGDGSGMDGVGGDGDGHEGPPQPLQPHEDGSYPTERSAGDRLSHGESDTRRSNTQEQALNSDQMVESSL